MDKIEKAPVRRNKHAFPPYRIPSQLSLKLLALLMSLWGLISFTQLGYSAWNTLIRDLESAPEILNWDTTLS